MAPIIRPSQGGSGGSENPPSNNLWIGNLGIDVSDSELKSILENHGRVDSITSYPTRNYAFVYFKDIEGAKSAKQNLQGHVLQGMSLKIEFAKPAKPNKSLWVAGISQSVHEEELEKEFLKFGNIQEFRFLRDRSTAYVDYERLEDAVQALKNMNGRRIGGGQLRVDFLRSQTARREQGSDARDGPFFGRNMGPTDFRWNGQDPLSHRAGSGLAGSKRQHHSLSPSRVLLISHPPSVIIEKDMLHNAMILFGEIERIMTFPERNYAFVEFRSAEEANRAKEGLQGKLFNDPRISIEFSSSEFPVPPEQMDIHGLSRTGIQGNNTPPLPGLGIRGPPMGLRTAFEVAPPGSEFSPQSRIGGVPSWRRSSPMNGVGSSPSAGPWDAYGSSQLHRDPKRSRYDPVMPLDRRDGFSEQYGLSSPSTFGASGSAPRVTTERDCIWRGLITKGGVPVCHARCVPFSEGIDFDLPDPVDISAKTGLDALTTHYEKATGFHLVFFLPDSEADFQSYTELLRFLGSKNRAGVVKFDDGGNLFLVPPDFLTNVLRVKGPERLYGVVLKFPEVAPSAIPANVQSVHPQHPENRWASSQTGYSVHQEQRPMPSNNPRVPHEDPMLSSKAPAHPVSHPAVTLTPELIASLTSLLPAKTGSSGFQMPVLPQGPVPSQSAAAAGHETDIQQWNHGHQSSSQLIHVPQAQSQGLVPVPSSTGHFYQPVTSYTQTHGRMTNLPQGAAPLQSGSMVAPENNSQQYQQGNTHGIFGGQGTDHWSDSSRFYNPSMVQQQAYPAASTSNQAYGSGVSQPQSYMPIPAEQPINNQSEQLQSAPPQGAGQESAESEAEKNERYKSTLLLAANLLSRLHQPLGNHPGEGSSGH